MYLMSVSRSSQCSTTGVTKAVGWCISERVAYVVAGGFLSHYLSGP